MVVRRSDSRRRKLMNPATQATPVASGKRTPKKSSSTKSKTSESKIEARKYAYGAERRNQLKTTDLLPKRFLSFALVVLALVACIAGLNFAANQAEQWQAVVGQDGVQALAIRGQGSLASWFSSFLLIMTGLASLQIYALRQHRCDDYRGTYRLWLWLAALLVVASVNCVVNLEDIARNVTTSISASVGQHPWFLLSIKLGALSLLVVRGIYEIRESRGAIALVALVWLAYVTATVMQIPAVNEQMVGLPTEMTIGNLTLFATTGLFLAHLTYARFIYLQANGLMEVKPKKKVAAKKKAKRKAKPKAKPKAEKTKATTESKPVKKATRKRTKPKPVEIAKEEVQIETEVKPQEPEAPVEQRSNEDERLEKIKRLAAASRAKQNQSQIDQQDQDEHEDVLPMTKSQKRKLRKQRKQQRRRAA